MNKTGKDGLITTPATEQLICINILYYLDKPPVNSIVCLY